LPPGRRAVTVERVFDPLLDPLLDGDPDETERDERLAVYDAYMGLFDAELDRALYRHGLLPGDDERTRIKWIVARFMQHEGTSDVDSIEAVLIGRFLPREQELRLLDQELDWVIDRHDGDVTPTERETIRAGVVDYLDANVTLGLADLERVYVTAIVPELLLDRHLLRIGAWLAEHADRLEAGTAWRDLARLLETETEALVRAHSPATGARGVRLQAMHLPQRLVGPLLAWAAQPEAVLHGAAGLRLVLALNEGAGRAEVVEAFRALDRFWKILLVRQGADEEAYWSTILREGGHP